MAEHGAPASREKPVQSSLSGRARRADAIMYAADIADRLGYSVDYFRRHIDRLVIEQRMPAALPSLGRLRWDRRAVEAWLGGCTHPRPANDDAPIAPAGELDDIEAQRAELAREYGAAR